jgi:FkbM family methyltransferase
LVKTAGELRANPRILRVAGRFLFKALHAWRRPHLVKGSASGLEFEIPSSWPMAINIYANSYERHEREILSQIVRPGMTMLDVGANIGYYTCLFATALGPSGRVIAFEPTPPIYERLQAHIAKNHLESSVTCCNQALGAAPGEASLYVFDEGGGYNSFGPVRSASSETPKVKVNLITLDAVLAGIRESAPFGIKIDVEGYEFQVLQGGRERLGRMENGFMMIELDERLAVPCGGPTLQSVELLERCGFKCFEMAGSERLVPLGGTRVDRTRAPGLQGDYFFFKGSFLDDAVRSGLIADSLTR